MRAASHVSGSKDAFSVFSPLISFSGKRNFGGWKIIPAYKIFHTEADTCFQGISAMPPRKCEQNFLTLAPKKGLGSGRAVLFETWWSFTFFWSTP